ncbi:hypothetical protein BJ912DRAFT_981813 [Pholiota molesta]|nr:hypothetical protein BJ912DRAFT_981813 [Pholiota molesta]
MTLTINHSLRLESKSSHVLTSVIGRLRTTVVKRWSSPLTPLLNIALRSPSLEKLALEGWDERRSPSIWNELRLYGISTILDELHASPCVKSLTVANTHDMPWDLVLSSFASTALHEMMFIHSTLDLRVDRGHADHISASNTVSGIKILTLLNLRYVDFFLGLRSYLPELPAGMVSKSPSIYFTSLHTLRINIPATQYDAETLAKFLLGVAGTLETLDLRMHHAMDRCSAYTILPLMKLISLKILKIRADMNDSVNSSNHSESVLTLESLQLISWALASTSSLPNLTSIHMELYIEITTSPLKDYFDVRRMSWGMVDQELDQPGFAALQNISLQIEKHHCDKSLGPIWQKTEDSVALLSSILPHVRGKQSVRVAFKVRSVYNSEPLSMMAYCRSL